MTLRPFLVTLMAVTVIGACRPSPVTDSGTEGDADADADSDADTDTDTDTDTDADADCPADAPTDWTLVGNGNPAINWPLITTATPYTNDANLSAVRAALPANHEDTAVVDITVTGATVSGVDFHPSGTASSGFWVEDMNTAIHIELFFAGNSGDVTVALNPGDRVSFTVTGVENYFDSLQAIDLDGFTVDSTGAPVYAPDISGTTINAAALEDHFVHLHGTVTSDDGGCGGSNICYTVDHGNGQTAILRANGDFVTFFVDDCVDLYAPLTNFQDNPQINLGNFDWYSFF